MLRGFMGSHLADTVRASPSHHQVASAIADDHGGDAFVRGEKKALHFYK
jgi:hypothetical protein